MTGSAAAYVASPSWLAVITQNPTETNVITVPVASTVHTPVDSLIYETVKPVEVLSENLSDVAMGERVKELSVNGLSAIVAKEIYCAVEPVLNDFFVGKPLTVPPEYVMTA